MDGKHKLQIVGITVVPYVNKKSQAKEELRLAQCVVTSESLVDGKPQEKVVVGELMLPKHLSETAPGTYLAEFELSVGQDKRIGSRVVALHPVGATSRPVPKAA